MELDIDASRKAIDKIASSLSLSSEEAAYAIYAIATEAMVGAISEITIEEGIDPRECHIVAGGGAAGLNAAAMARELSVGKVIVPRTAGALSACGGLYADIVTEASATFYARTENFPMEEVNKVLDDLEASLSAMAEMLRARGLDRIDIEYRMEARYPFQSWELDVPLPFKRFRDQADVDRMKQAFHDVHERVFAVSEPGAQIECLFWRARLVAPFNERPEDSFRADGDSAAVPRSRCTAFFGREPVETARYEGREISTGMSIRGPAIVDEATTTIVVPPDVILQATNYNYLLSFAPDH
jgi:N-methylhydantoinase A